LGEIPVKSEEMKRTQQDPGPEMKNSFNKRETMSGKRSPRCVLEIPISDGSPVSERLNSPGSSSSSSPSASRQNTIEKGTPKGGSSYGYGIPWKGIFGSGKRKSRGRRFSTSSIPLLSNCELTAKTIRQKLLRMWTAEVGVDCGLGFVRKPHWRNFSYSELEAATGKFSPGKGTQTTILLID